MVDEKTTEKIEQLASETVIKISNMVQSGLKEKSTAVKRSLMKLRVTETVKISKYFLKVYETFLTSAQNAE